MGDSFSIDLPAYCRTISVLDDVDARTRDAGDAADFCSGMSFDGAAETMSVRDGHLFASHNDGKTVALRAMRWDGNLYSAEDTNSQELRAMSPAQLYDHMHEYVDATYTKTHFIPAQTMLNEGSRRSSRRFTYQTALMLHCRDERASARAEARAAISAMDRACTADPEGCLNAPAVQNASKMVQGVIAQPACDEGISTAMSAVIDRMIDLYTICRADENCLSSPEAAMARELYRAFRAKESYQEMTLARVPQPVRESYLPHIEALKAKDAGVPTTLAEAQKMAALYTELQSLVRAAHQAGELYTMRERTKELEANSARMLEELGEHRALFSSKLARLDALSAETPATRLIKAENRHSLIGIYHSALIQSEGRYCTTVSTRSINCEQDDPFEMVYCDREDYCGEFAPATAEALDAMTDEYVTVERIVGKRKFYVATRK